MSCGMVTGVVCFALSGCQVFGFTNYEVFGVVEEFGPGYVLGFPKLSGCLLRCCWVGSLMFRLCSTQEFKMKSLN